MPGLCSFTSVENAQQCLDIFSEFFFDVIEDHVKKPTNKVKLLEAKLLLQMVFTKILHLKNILNGISFQKKNIYLNKIIDPGVVAIIIRNLYETIGLFHLIYIHPDTEEQQDLIYDLWCHAGLRTRQRFKESFEATERRSVLDEEKQDMVLITQSINNNPYFLSLDEHNKKKV